MNVFFKEKLDSFLKSTGISRVELEKTPDYFYQFLETTAGLYHIYLKGNNSQNLVYRSDEFIQIINRMALAAHAKGVTIWAYTFLTNHLHILVQPQENAEQIIQFKHHFRMSLSHYYNTCNNSEGMVGCRKCIAKQIHISRDLSEPKDIISYILRNPVRHNIIDLNPFDYKWSSIHYYFCKEKNANPLLQSLPEAFTLPDNSGQSVKKYIPGRAFLPDNWQITQSGLIHPGSYLANEAIELLYKDHHTFKQAMFIPGERENANISRDTQQYASDNRRHPLSIKKQKEEKILDIQASEYICSQIGNAKIPSLSLDQKIRLAKEMKRIFPQITFVQLSRILTVPRSTLHRLWSTQK